MSFWVRRPIASDFVVNDLGVTIRASSERDLSLSFDTQVLTQSADLATALSSSALQRIDGPDGSVIPAADAFNDADIAAHIAADFPHHPHANKGILDDITDAGSGAVMSTAERSKLSGIEAGAEVNDTGAEILTKLQGQPAPLALNVTQVGGATAAQLRDRATHTGTQSASTISDFATAADARITAKYNVANGIPQADANGTLPKSRITNFDTEVDARITAQKNVANGVMGLDASGNALPPGLVDGRDIAADGTKLDGIEAGATADQTPSEILSALQGLPAPLSLNVTSVQGASAAQLRDRATHTGAQTASTISDFATAADARITAQKGAVNGLATLDAGGKIPVAQIPATALPQVYVVANAAARLALTVQEGDEAIQIDDGSHWIYDGSTWYLRPSGSGDVTGPASSVDNRLVRFDGTTGKVIQESPVTVDDAGNVTGVATVNAVVVEDHSARHAPGGADSLPVGVPVPIAALIGSIGSALSYSLSDHLHAHGVQSEPTLHAVATTSVAGFMSAADKTKLNGVATGATNTPLSSTPPTDVGTTAVGVGTSAARADHVHAHGNQAGGSLHAAATTSVAGFMSAADKTKLDALPPSGVPTTRQIIAGAGLTGGGDLSADRTLNVVANADGSIVANANDVQVGVLATDEQHGNRGGGSQHALAVAAGAAGFLSGDDKAKLDALVWGTQYQNVENLGTLSTTGTAYVEFLRLTTPVIPAGRYAVEFYCEVGSARESEVFITMDGAITIARHRERHEQTNDNYVVSGVVELTLTNAAHFIVMAFRRPGGSSTTVTIQAGQLTIYRRS